MAPEPDRLALFLLASSDEGVASALTDTLRRLGFEVRGEAAESDTSVVLDYLSATYSIFMITGETGAGETPPPQPSDDGRRVPSPGAYAVVLAGVGKLEAPEGVGSLELDSAGKWLATIVRWLAELGWTEPGARPN